MVTSPAPITHGFPYDPFQKQAIEAIERGVSLLVAAPTGAGKTVIADYAIAKALQEGKTVIYTAPIKALSNQKYREFHRRYGGRIGIVTGDVSVNPRGACVIMTTEIYRNTLLEDPERLARCSWAIFDEVHYIDDTDRGTVWEESILFTPPHINLLCLSATIPNAEELARWTRQVHGRELEVIREDRRPVPLHVAFQCQGQILANAQQLRSRGYLNHEDWRGQFRRGRRGERIFLEAHPNRADHLIATIKEKNHLPCLYFTFGRRRAEDLAEEMGGRFGFLKPEERNDLLALYDKLIERYDLKSDRSAWELKPLVEHGVAYHHAGMLPSLKEVVEQLFSSRLIKLIVTTETFALGINMPARSVVLDTLRKQREGRWSSVSARDFSQMSGRAGRRGMDEAGFVYVRVNPHEVPYPDVVHAVWGAPERVQSRLNTAYATLLNLYRSNGRDLLNFYDRSFHAFQSSLRSRQEVQGMMSRKLALLQETGYLDERGLTHKGEFASWMYGYELLLAELFERKLLEDLNETRLSVLLAGLVYESKRGIEPIRLNRTAKQLLAECDSALKSIHREEMKFRISPKTRPAHFQLSAAMEAWVQGAQFEKLTGLSGVDEGEIVRYFRMAVQLLRQIREAPGVSEKLRGTAEACFRRINRDVIDAEQQLRFSESVILSEAPPKGRGEAKDLLI